MKPTPTSLIFLAGSIIGGLALAFVLIALRPELLRGFVAGRGKPQNVATTAPASNAPRAATLDANAPIGRASPAASSSHSDIDTGANPMARASYASAVRRAGPAVVNIYTARVVTERLPPQSIEDFMGEIGPRYRQRVERALGSGVIVDAAGHIVTNHHVIADADSVRVQLADGRIAAAKVVGRDPDTDLAVLQINLAKLPTMPFGRSDQLQVGDVVLAIGNPIGLSQTVTQGIVSATGRGQLGLATFENFIQTDAPINVGNSGGALVNSNGELIGINTAVIAKNLGVEGIGFAIPVNLVRGVMAELLRSGRVVRGWIGIVPEDVPDEQAQQLGLARGGVVIANLYRGSPALAVGQQPGDIVVAIDGVPARTAQETLARIAQSKPGGKLVLNVLRGTQTAKVEVPITERPRTTK